MLLHKGVCRVFVMLLLVPAAVAVHAQDSLRVTIADAERQFARKNFYALAAQLNVDVQKAQEIQASLYQNPIVSAELNAIDPENNKKFHNGSTGQKVIAIEQLLLLGGKRKNQVALAQLNTRQASLELETLMRNLNYELRQAIYTVYFDLQTVHKYEQQLQQLDTLINIFDVQAKKGNIGLMEVVRLKSAYIKLNNDKAELLQNIQVSQRTLQLLLQTSDFVVPNLSANEWERLEKIPPVDSLVQLASQKRADIKQADLNRTAADVNLKLQRSLAVPDLQLGAQYDQRGGAFNNQVNLMLAMPLPLWNRNQGNIRSAQTQTQVADLQKQIQVNEVNADVANAWHNMRRSIQEYEKIKQVYDADFIIVVNGITENFRKRNISIVEFLDFYESYNETIAEVNRIRKQLALSGEAINYAVAFPIYP